MNILGINQYPGMLAWTHDSAAALIKDGRLIAAAEEERFNRLRHSRGYPHRAAAYCLDEGNLKKEDIDLIAVSYDAYQPMGNFFRNLNPRGLAQSLLNLGFFWFYKKNIHKEFPKAEVICIPHHLSHAASSYRCSGFDEANILVVDASGETETFSFFIGRKNKIKKIWDIKLDKFGSRGKKNSIGLVYTKVTNFLGLGVHGEGKTMGLASYGDPAYDFSEILNIFSHKNYCINRHKLTELYGHLERKNPNEELRQEHKNLAASLQNALEESILKLAKEAYDYSKIKNFCLAGGVTLNCNTNSRILDEKFCDKIFIQPAANDGGAALGAALEASSRFDRPINFRMDTAYWGPDFTEKEIETLLQEAKIPFSRHKDIENITARLLAEGKIIGWFQGRSELGPRALCNRSILADPTIPGMNDRINNMIKHREAWRPFAPVVMEENMSEYFDNQKPSPFMLLTFYVKEQYRKRLPAITHIDGSSRIQTINKTQNPRCYELLKEFKKIKGVPVLLNTSFNDKGEPIVNTPKDALKCFFSTGLDALVMGNYLVKKAHGL